jgi:translation initiation factor eIF-2B subunit epsilon
VSTNVLTALLSRFPGDDASDLDLSDPGSVTSSEESESSSDDEANHHLGSMPSSSATSLLLSTPAIDVPSEYTAAESEFRAEVELSLQRAFAEGHTVDNAAVELKTLRMASNVPISRVREAIVAAIVEQVPIVLGDEGPAAQRREIARVVGRWGQLIDKIGGVDAVQTILALQVGGNPLELIIIDS